MQNYIAVYHWVDEAGNLAHQDKIPYRAETDELAIAAAKVKENQYYKLTQIQHVTVIFSGEKS